MLDVKKLEEPLCKGTMFPRESGFFTESPVPDSV